DLGTLGDYDDWTTMLVGHEYTHVVHMDTIGGLASIVNALLGKVYAPNQVQPAWVLEGLAVWDESRQTGGGRMRSTVFDMYLRMDALEGRLLGIDEVSNVPLRWPRGNVPYLYGSQFLGWIADRYGARALRLISQTYGRQALPYPVNRVAREVPGRTLGPPCAA